MIAEPYISIKGPRAGEIHWLGGLPCTGKDTQPCVVCQPGCWQLYADFEREKLRELNAESFPSGASFVMDVRRDETHVIVYCASAVIGYNSADYWADSESSRLLKRAEFLKAVCEKEGVEFLPKTLATGGLVTEKNQVLPECDASFCQCKEFGGSYIKQGMKYFQCSSCGLNRIPGRTPNCESYSEETTYCDAPNGSVCLTCAAEEPRTSRCERCSGKMAPCVDENSLKKIGTITKFEFNPMEINIEWDEEPERDYYTREQIDNWHKAIFERLDRLEKMLKDRTAPSQPSA